MTSRGEIVRIDCNYSNGKNRRNREYAIVYKARFSRRDSFISHDRIFYLSFGGERGTAGHVERERKSVRARGFSSSHTCSGSARAATVAAAFAESLPSKAQYWHCRECSRMGNLLIFRPRDSPTQRKYGSSLSNTTRRRGTSSRLLLYVVRDYRLVMCGILPGINA